MILNNDQGNVPGVPIAGDDVAAQIIREIDVTAIRPNRSQPRDHFDEQALAELVASVQEHGLLQPLIVTEHPQGGYELVAGERRWRAARRAGLMRVPALVKDVTSLQLLELALVENVQRADLNPLEEGRAYQTLKDEFGLKDEEIARRVGKSRVTVVNARRLMRLIPAAQQSLIAGTITAGHGRALLRLEQPEQQAAALALVLRADLSVREIERVTEFVLDPRLAPAVPAALLAGSITTGHAQALLCLDDTTLQATLLDRVVTHGMAVRETERLCTMVATGTPVAHACDQLNGHLVSSSRRPDQLDQPSPQRSHESSEAVESTGALSAQRTPPPEDAAVQRMFEEVLGTPVQLTRTGTAIKLTIMLYSEEQMQGLYDLMASAV
ncbi:MAG: ParB/RepB/Spo0J family partition protein [Chloroflexaceae bacterium]